MNPEETTFVTYRRRRGRYRKGIDLEDIDQEDQVMDRTESQTSKGKRTMEDDDQITFNGFINALNDLAKGQKEMLNAINRLENREKKRV